MKFLTKWNTEAAYEAAESGLIKPQVALIKETNEVKYKEYAPQIIDGHEYINLGLPSGTLWASMNIGSESLTGYGDFYQYGKGAAQYSTTSGQSLYSGTDNPLAASADTAVQVWGGRWHMPTSAQCQELIDNTTSEWIDDYNGTGINVRTFTANGQTLIVPASGNWFDGQRQRVNEFCYIISSTPDSSNLASMSWTLNAYNTRLRLVTINRRGGYPIRPVVG